VVSVLSFCDLTAAKSVFYHVRCGTVFAVLISFFNLCTTGVNLSSTIIILMLNTELHYVDIYFKWVVVLSCTVLSMESCFI
jgi:hypothetical protein